MTSGFAAPPAGKPADLSIAADIEARRRQFVTKDLVSNLAVLDVGDRKALDHLVAAAKLIHAVFKMQACPDSPDLDTRVARLSGPLAVAAREYYRIMAKPWDELKEHEPFLGTPTRPPGVGFYPADLTKTEFERWIREHPADEQAFVSPTTVIRRGTDGKLSAAGYGKEYRRLLDAAAAELKLAAKATTNRSLARYLDLRAEAFRSDDYFASDMAWMDLDGPIEVVIGPYETYEDALFGYKASFEAFVCISQPDDSKALAHYKEELPSLERSLPIPDEYKNLKRGGESPIRVADVVFSAGDARSGVQTIAFNLPNDERVREAKGSKKVLLKNMMRAKYEAILVPIASRVLPASDAKHLDFDSYFHFILFHEMSHGLGPGRLNLNGRQTEVRLELKDLHSAIEEAKADVLGIHDLYVLADKGKIPEAVVTPLPWTYTAGLFRTARFGTTEAHGLGVVLQTDFLLDRGAIEVTADGRFRPVLEKFRPAIEALARELLTVEARGDYEGARKLVEKFGKPPASMMKHLDALREIPVDVDPFYALFEKK
jgi:hypothetical protein